MLKHFPPNFFRNNQQNFCNFVKKMPFYIKGDLVLLKGPVEVHNFDDDANSHVFPENLYFYLTGISSDDKTYALVDPEQRRVVVFVFEEPASAFTWKKVKAPADFVKEFEVDEALFEKELRPYLDTHFNKDNTLYLYVGTNPYSGLETLNPLKDKEDVLVGLKLNTKDLFEHACEARVLKSKEEQAVIQRAVDLASLLHKHTMRAVRKGMTEGALARVFASTRTMHGSGVPYETILGSGANAAFLHYVPSEQVIGDQDLILMDAGCQVGNYCSDLTRVFPASGKFSVKQRDMYNVVLRAQTEAIAAIKPGVSWVNVHVTAEKAVLKGLTELGLLKCSLEDGYSKRAVYHFFPHGVGHYIGLYTHDLPGLKYKENKPLPFGKKMTLRVKRRLEVDMVLTVEPGVYFNDLILQSGFDDPDIGPFFDKEKIKEYQKEVGGIRIEDMIVVTESGCRVLSLNLPKTVEEIEKIMAK